MEDDRWPKISGERRVIWPRAKETSDDVVNEKIHSAFGNVKSFPLNRIIIQFWRPLKTSAGAEVLSCSGNPYALSPVNHRLRKYRSHSARYYYCIDATQRTMPMPVASEISGPMTIRGAPPARAFLSHFPDVVMDLRLHRGTPLVDLALECELTCFMTLPVFYGFFPVGVIEVSTRLPSHLLVLFNELNVQLKRVDLSISQPNTLSQPCEAITGDWGLAKSEIGKALQVACTSHAITHGQVWICYDTPCGLGRRKLLGKVKSYSVFSPDEHLSSVKLFYFCLHCLPLDKGPGLVRNTLETLRPHLCENIYKLGDNRGLLAVLSANTKCTCFVICLRSSHTGNLDYAFEFFWPQSANHLAMMEALLLTLREHLPSFKYAFGAQLGEELLVVDVENSSLESGSTHVKIFPGNKSSDKEALVGMKRKSRAAVGMKRITRASVGLKTKTRVSSIKGQSELTNINNPEGEDDEDLIIFGVYKVDYRLFFLPNSSTFENLMEKVNQEFELNPACTYMIEYQVLPGEWHSLMDVTCLKGCVSSYRASKNIDHIKLRVVVVEK